MKTAVEAVFIGKGRFDNRRFQQSCSHCVVQPLTCRRRRAWEKVQVENHAGLMRAGAPSRLVPLAERL